MSRCKLISPVLLQLERPMLSPVEESEFVIDGVKEHEMHLREMFAIGLMVGMLLASLVVGIAWSFK